MSEIDPLPAGYSYENDHGYGFITRVGHGSFGRTWDLTLPYESADGVQAEYVVEMGCRLDVADAARRLIGALADAVAFIESQPDDEGVPSRSRHSEPISAGMDPLGDAQGELELARSLRIDVASLRTAIDPVKHSPAKVRAYLAANGWRLMGEVRGFTEWERSGETVMVLPEAGSREYAKRMAIYVQAIATVHKVGELSVLAGIAAVEPESSDG